MWKKSILWDFLVFVVAIVVIFYQFNAIPKALALDELEFGRLALTLKDAPYTPYSQYATGHTTSYYYIILASFNLLGISTFALRLPAAIFGLLGALVFYRLMKLVFERKGFRISELGIKKLQSLQVPLAVILALVFVTLRWYFNFARFAFEATYLIFLELISLYFILRAVRSKNLREIALSAIFAGLAYNSYVVGRMFFVVPLFYLIVFYLGGVDKRHLRGADNSRYKTPEVIKRVFYFLIPFLIVIAPLTLYFSQNPDIRVSQQLYFLDPNLELPQKISFFFSNIWENMKMFIVSGAGDANGRHNYPFKPALNPVIFILFIAGLLSALKNWKRRYNSVFLVYFLVGFFPTILTYPHENPNMLRTVTILPSVVYFVGLAIQASYNFITRLSLKPPLRWTHSKFVKILPLFLLISILLGLVGSSLYEFRTYFIFQKLVFEEAFDVRDGLERVHELRPPQ